VLRNVQHDLLRRRHHIANLHALNAPVNGLHLAGQERIQLVVGRGADDAGAIRDAGLDGAESGAALAVGPGLVARVAAQPGAGEDGGAGDVEGAREGLGGVADLGQLGGGDVADGAGGLDARGVLGADVVVQDVVVEGAQDVAGAVGFLVGVVAEEKGDLGGSVIFFSVRCLQARW
jgi:hypothetical protein